LVTKDEDAFAPDGVEVRVAGHPVPDRRSALAADEMLKRLSRIEADERVVAVLSGGASSLLTGPLPGLTLADVVRANRALLHAGLPIADINVVRKHLTRASGGRLARACRAPIDVLVMSDVLGDDISAIGSGPFAPAASTFEEALAIARRVPDIGGEVLSFLERGELEAAPEHGSAARHRLIASHATLMEAAVEAASSFGRVRSLPAWQGTVIEAARRYADEAEKLTPGEIVLGGGEPTLELDPFSGIGGRCQQLALLVARALFARGIKATFLAIGSDGSDGPTDAAGAVIDEQSWDALARAGDPESAIARADAHPILDAIGALVRTGATGTNLLDLHLLARS
jgi:hydroxypyruvate reductase